MLSRLHGDRTLAQLSRLQVVTVPRDVPARLILELCHEGTVKDRVTNSNLNMSVLLSFCHDVASGLQYRESHAQHTP